MLKISLKKMRVDKGNQEGILIQGKGHWVKQVGM